MKTKSFREELQEAKEHGYAVGAFNIFNYLSARAVIRAAQKLDSPVILQTSTQTARILRWQRHVWMQDGILSCLTVHIFLWKIIFE